MQLTDAVGFGDFSIRLTPQIMLLQIGRQVAHLLALNDFDAHVLGQLQWIRDAAPQMTVMYGPGQHFGANAAR